ncbi:YoaK family protein [Mucilaginibacter sp. UYCu711]|uniref:YoaK family protein n=1 Tax=Mucilaginibacter sp. UYCu711 TaxID=3156339 RepID=UPI003D24369A
MLRHLGAKRTPNHNLKLATLLGLTAGFVNAEGFLGFSVLTTNVTGHAALLAERIAFMDWRTATVIALWMFLFLAGAFFTSIALSFTGENQRFSYFIPVIIEILILLISGLYGHKYNGTLASKEFFAGSLLFAMGLQNALVSMVSGSVVRTTHLTGTFTDLGIDLAQILHGDKARRPDLKSRIKLRLYIIFFFMTGAVFGAYLFHRFGFPSFYAPVLILLFALVYDLLRIKAKRYYRTGVNAVKRTIGHTE